MKDQTSGRQQGLPVPKGSRGNIIKGLYYWAGIGWGPSGNHAADGFPGPESRDRARST